MVEQQKHSINQAPGVSEDFGSVGSAMDWGKGILSVNLGNLGTKEL